jgi:hypothetical protein
MREFDWSKYQRQHVQAVDMVAATIFANRVKYIPVKAVHLWPSMYDQFRAWAEKLIGRELEPDEHLEFDTVYIEKGTRSQSTPIVVEVWDNGINEVKINPKMFVLS